MDILRVGRPIRQPLVRAEHGGVRVHKRLHLLVRVNIRHPLQRLCTLLEASFHKRVIVLHEPGHQASHDQDDKNACEARCSDVPREKIALDQQAEWTAQDGLPSICYLELHPAVRLMRTHKQHERCVGLVALVEREQNSAT
eukprot:2373979-Prymnesium_polylepis.1